MHRRGCPIRRASISLPKDSAGRRVSRHGLPDPAAVPQSRSKKHREWLHLPPSEGIPLPPLVPQAASANAFSRPLPSPCRRKSPILAGSKVNLQTTEDSAPLPQRCGRIPNICLGSGLTTAGGEPYCLINLRFAAGGRPLKTEIDLGCEPPAARTCTPVGTSSGIQNCENERIHGCVVRGGETQGFGFHAG